MTWRVVSSSVVGTSHTANGIACQDSCAAQVQKHLSNTPLLTIFVADGAGSAIHGGIGAELAIEAAMDFINQHCSLSEFTLNDYWAVECIQSVRERIYTVANQQELKARDYACTFLGVIASPFITLLMQIGDGGIVVDIGNGLEVPISPMIGEYANMTHFITEKNAIDILAVEILPARLEKVAVFSDGIQRLAMNMSSNTAYSPFFTPFFTVLETASFEEEEDLCTKLASFLQSQAVNERTDDDKTLAFAHWINIS